VTVPPAPAAPPVDTGPWAPLREPVYRRLWLAQVVSNLGTWMQTVGAQWVVVSASGSAVLVSLVQTASTLPVVLLAAPAGVLADVLDRRRVLVTVQSSMVVVAALLATLTFLGDVNAPVMLGFTFLLGIGAAFVGPAWQAIQPDLVPRTQLPQAAALGAVNMNLARAVGPALGGLLVAAAGAGWVFALNAVSFVVVAMAVSSWRRQVQPDPVGREPLVAALRSGARFVRYAPAMRRVLSRCLLFVPAASCLWALLPVVATDLLGLGSGGYGLLLGALGIGAVAGAVVLPRIRTRLGSEPVTFALFLLYAAVLVVVALTSSAVLTAAVLTLAGASWLGVLSTLNATAQQVLPGWVRARALSYYLVVFMAGQAAGGIVWGAMATRLGLRDTFLIAGVLTAAGGIAARLRPLVDPARLDPTSSSHWTPTDFPEPDALAGPVLVTAEYFVPEEAREAFIAALPPLSRSRRRTGARDWGMFQDPADSDRFVEVFVVATWAEHARQHHGRLTKIDRAAEERVRNLAGGPPVVRHLLALPPRPAGRRRGR
jgi:MFS family permease